MTSRHAEMAKALTARQHSRRPSFFRALGRRLNWLSTREIVAQAAFIGLLSSVMVLLTFPSPINYQVGDVAEFTIRSDRAFRVADEAATETRRLQAAARVAPVFVLDDDLSARAEEEAASIFRRGRELTAVSEALMNAEETERRNRALAELEGEFQQVFSQSPGSAAWASLVRLRFNASLERPALGLAAEVMGRGLLDRPNPFPGQGRVEASIVVLPSRREYFMPSAAGLLDMETAARFIELGSRRFKAVWGPEEVRLIVALARGLTRPNLRPDEPERERRIQAARQAVPEAWFNVRAGEVIVREGAIITPEVLEKIRVMKSFAGGYEWLPRFFGLFLALFVFFNVSLVLAHLGPRNTYKPVAIKEMAFVTILLVLVAFMAHGAHIFGASLAWDFDFLDSRTVFYAMPVSTAAMLMSIFFGTRKAAIMALFAAVTAATVTTSGGRFLSLIYCFNGAITAVWCLRNMNERGHLIPAAFWVMVINCLTLAGLTLYGDVQWGRQTAYNFGAAALSGVLSAVIASGLIPLVEAGFGFNTDLKLLELGNLDRPILRELMLSAPGTYHHSVIVGAMVEAAAEAIGANPHLAKVGAYYHDIGKMKKPLYFVENQTGENRHDTLAPSMSALILIGHVREGVELAQETGLPKNIVDIVEQHHGTSLMSFFYHKAKEQRQEGQPEVNEGDYRYPGPRPRSKEAGLVMIGDICEAATRSLSEPTPTKIRNLVRQLVNQIFSDGQLDDCQLRTREISEVVNTFTTILIGIYHHRIAYPGAKKTGGPEDDKKNRPAVKEIYGHLPVEPAKGVTH